MKRPKKQSNNVCQVQLLIPKMIYGRLAVLQKKSKTAGLLFEQKLLKSQKRMHRGLLEDRKCKQAERREKMKRRERREMDRMRAFMKFLMKAIVTVVKETTKNN